MSRHPSPRNWLSFARIGAIALLRLRRITRTRLALAAVVLVMLPWALVDSPSLLTRLASLAEFTLVGATAIGAGALGDDIDSGEYAIVMTHDAAPVEVLAGQWVASLTAALVLVALQLPIAFGRITTPPVTAILICLGWLAALLAGWMALMLLLATVIEGRGNALAMVTVFLLPPIAASGLLDGLPSTAAQVIRALVRLLPQLTDATTMFGSVLGRARPPALTPIVLLASPFLYFTLASLRLHRIEPAGRLTQ